MSILYQICGISRVGLMRRRLKNKKWFIRKYRELCDEDGRRHWGESFDCSPGIVGDRLAELN